MRVQNQPAYILHQRPFRDTSQIIDIFSRDYGRLTVMSRGSRSAKSRLKHTLQPFSSLLMSWSGKGEMPTLSSVEALPVKSFYLSGHALPSGLYINELLIKLLHKHDVHEPLFYIYESVIKLLADKAHIEPVLRMFEKQLLESLGFGLNLDVNVDSGEAILPDTEYVYYLEHGPVDASSIQDDAYVLKLYGKSLIDFHNNQLDSEQSLKDAKRLMRAVLQYYLGDKTIKSRELFRK